MRREWSMILLVATALVVARPAWAQASQDKAPIEIKKKVLGTQYFYNGRMVNVFGLPHVVKDCPEALTKVRTAQVLYVPGLFFAGLGGGLLGMFVGEAITGQDPSLAIAAVGGASLCAGMGLAFASEASVRRGVDTYNKSIGSASASASRTPSVQIAFSPQSVGVRMRF